VDRALQLLMLLRQHGRLSVTAAAEQLGVSPSAAHRLLSALCYRGFADQDRQRHYRPGPQLADSGSAEISRAALRRLVRPALEQLLKQTGETTHLMVLDGADIVFLDGVESEEALRVGLRNGIRMPAYCSSAGKAMLAALPKSEVDRLHARGLPPWPNARTTTLAALHRQLAAARKQGYAFNQEESEQGVVAVGGALLGQAGKPLAGISVSIPSARYRRADLGHYAAAVIAATGRAQARLDDAAGSDVAP
jgi:DNA-binding IclR family transcriptional regulator